MQNDVEAVHTAIAGLDVGRGRPYPPELREQMVETARTLKGAGWSWPAIAEAFGMSPHGLRKFMQRWEERLTASTMRPVVVEKAEMPEQAAPAPRHPKPLRLVSPTGWRVEGLTVDTAAALLAKLPC